ncbi:MAG: MBL fold metallo-hydrolase [Phycisphaerales bacterium]|nr:MBL fold metallo-hydrolase [Phycisphaerales bacterium]
MFMRLIYDEKLAQGAYIIGCQKSGEAIVIDPQRDVDRYIEVARANDLKIVAAAETHIHADFVSGARELAHTHGVRVYVSGEGGQDWQSRWAGEYDHVIIKDGDTFSIGNIEFRAVHTPGHTPEHMVYLVTDHGSGASEPIGICTGDFLFVGDLGRPDLLESAAGQRGAMEPSAKRLFSSAKWLGQLPEYIQVWPGHGAGSACGKALGAVPMSTVGYERRFNPALKLAIDDGANEGSFVSFILEGQPEPPVYFANMKRVNRDGPPVLGSLPQPYQVRLNDLAKIDPQQVAIIDTRPWPQYRDGHLPGAMSFPLSTTFNTDAGSMVREDEQIYLIVEPERLEEAVRDLVRIGLDRIVGWMDPNEMANAAKTASIAEVSPSEAAQRIDRGEVAVLDVRRATEFAAGRLDGAQNIAHTRLASRLDELPADRTLLIHCQGGIRSARACGYLQRLGYGVINMEGGYEAWQRAHTTANA